MTQFSPSHPWLSLVGIGEDGIDGLSHAARTLLAQAQLVIGGARHLALAGPLTAETLIWPSPLAAAIPAIIARRGSPVCVLASGDPFFYGVGTVLCEHIPLSEIICLPAPSSFSLAAARLGWSLQNCRMISVHGRDLLRLVPHLQPGAKILSLTWDETTPGRIADLLRERGFGASRLHVLEALGGPRERHFSALAADFDAAPGDPLNIAAIEVAASPGARIVPLGTGLPDDWFENDGQITKREVRAMTLAALAPRRGDHLWDIGAGAGSIGIEWMLLDPANRAAAIEKDESRAARIARNAARFGVPDLAIVKGDAPGALAGLARPDAIFVGGGAGSGALLDAAYAALAPGGRLVVNAVSLETQALLIARFTAQGGDLTSIAVARADKIGGFHGWRPAMPVTQWAITKP
jgi:precorrin-6Y C5,15-methyltransferase (decarboxylating)